MRAGLFLAYWPWFTPQEQVDLAVLADEIGLDSVWISEAWGQDAVSVLGLLAGKTERVALGSGLFQIPARAPAATAMAAATLDVLSGGRFRLGLGVSGPQVSEGWHGVRFGKPLARTREYVDIVKLALSRSTVSYQGEHYVLPLPDGPGKALKLGFHPIRTEIPIYLAAVGPRNLELAGEIADGWLAVFYAPEFGAEHLAAIAKGRARVGKDLSGFDVATSVPVVFGDDPEVCAELVRWYAALYIGGMGSREKNFYNDLAVRMGYGEAAAEIQDLYLSGRQRDAAALVPFEFIDRTSLLGPVERVAERMRAYAESGVTTLSVNPFTGDADSGRDALRKVAEAYELSGAGD